MAFQDTVDLSLIVRYDNFVSFCLWKLLILPFGDNIHIYYILHEFKLAKKTTNLYVS